MGVEEGPHPECLLLDATGLAPLFGGEERFLELVSREFARRGLLARLALADTIGAAWAVAHEGGPHDLAAERGRLVSVEDRRWAPATWLVPPGESAAVLAPLPIEGLRLSAPRVRLLRELGLSRIGPLLAVPRVELAARFGDEVSRRLDQALGNRDETIVGLRPEAETRLTWLFEPPTDRRESIEAAARELLGKIAAELAAKGRGVRRFVLRLGATPSHGLPSRRLPSQAEPSHGFEVEVGLYRASACPEHLWELARVRLEDPGHGQNGQRGQRAQRGRNGQRGQRSSFRGGEEPLASLEIEVLVSDLLECRQRELFESGATFDDERELAMLIDRLAGRLGRERVSRARLLPDAQPEFAWRYESPSRNAGGPGPLTEGNAGKRGAGERGARKSSRRKRLLAPPPPAPAGAMRPLFLYSPPRPLAMVSVVPDGPPLSFVGGPLSFVGEQGEERVTRAWGPERIETGWWRGRTVKRDYWRVETSLGAWWWLFRRLEDGQWFLQGVFE